MPTTFGRKKRRQNSVLYTLITIFLICTVFLSMVTFLYHAAEDEAYEMLHIQTKQIKDDITLQIKSDRENLVTMANFAANLYEDGEGYDTLFASFKPIGLFSNIGILNPDNTFVTKRGSIDLTGKISFADEVARGEYITGRVPDLTRDGYEIIRTAVPVQTGDETIGILYGVIHLDTLSQKYETMAAELNAQLFVYEKTSGNFVINTAVDELGNVSTFKNRKYNDGYSYESLIENPNGYSSFRSTLAPESLYLHYSTMEDIGWCIMLGRYESQVFAKTHVLSWILFISFLATFLIMAIYVLYLVRSEKRRSLVLAHASKTRKLLLEINRSGGNISEALGVLLSFSSARFSFVIDADGEEFHSILSENQDKLLCNEDRKFLIAELFRYATELYTIQRTTVGLLCISPNNYLHKTNPSLYHFLNQHKIQEVMASYVTDKNNHVTVLGIVNPSKKLSTRMLLEDVAVCFSIALYNKKHLNKTETAATTDSLTGAMNRVSYKNDILLFDEERPTDFSCIYIDVNELHLRNNKHGHAAGDEMLIYIANTLKEVFYGQFVYRMGGDEFLVFIKNVKQEKVKKYIGALIDSLTPMGYHIAIGMSHRSQNTNCEELVREAEVRMYEAKAEYYQDKEKNSTARNADKSYTQTKTGILEIDTMLSILKDHYHGIYRVSLNNDHAHRILMPSYLGYHEEEEHFSQLFSKYVDEMVHPDFHRPVMSFLNYDVIRRQLADGTLPRMTYKKMNGETVLLSIYPLGDDPDKADNTLWVFAKD